MTTGQQRVPVKTSKTYYRRFVLVCWASFLTPRWAILFYPWGLHHSFLTGHCVGCGMAVLVVLHGMPQTLFSSRGPCPKMGNLACHVSNIFRTFLVFIFCAPFGLPILLSSNSRLVRQVRISFCSIGGLL